ncbi:MAG: SEC-C domain-containing protein [Myxococcales bacterium]|jgi:tetratricopeptide (TPR) repeat protein|nr:SEC-C domain-containing protein [Myxococcales bacterium]
MGTPAHIFKTARRQIRKLRHRGASTDQERRLLASADQQRACGLGWRYDGFDDFSTQALFDKLAELGIALDEAAFCQSARAQGSPTLLAETWRALTSAEGRWIDFPDLAARELWRRLLPDMRSAEVVSDELDALLERAEVASPDEKVSLWFRAARCLLDACLRDGVADEDFFKAVLRESGGDLTGWMAELPPALMGTPFELDAPGIAAEFARFVERRRLLAERAELLLRLGKPAEAQAEIDALLDAHPDDLHVLLKAGGIYEALGEPEKAQRYLGAYARRLEERRARQVSSTPAFPPRRPSEPSASMKAAPNAPCPCGSGKKFKRCHGLPN